MLMHSSTRLLALVPLLAAGANALNDWTVPCTSGECSYDLPSANNSSSGSLKIWGSNNAITDITKAAGWEIIGCNSSALAQDIRLVCTDDPDDPNSKCSHLYQEIGAVNKIVRLPENCGASAFARVSKSWVPEDQSIPAAVRRSLVRRDGKTPVVKALALDTNFDAVDYSKTGPVNIAIQGANVPGVPTDIQTPSSRRARTTHRRFSIDNALGSIKDGIDNAASSVKAAAGDVKDAAESVASKATSAVKGAATKVESKAKDAATKAASAAKGAATKAESKVKDAASKAESAAKGAATKVAGAAKAAASDAAAAAKSVANNTIDVSKDINLKPLTFDKSVNLVNSQINCGKASASLQVDMDANANAQATLSVAATGTIVPPKLTSMGVIAGMTADVTGTMTMTADITGHVDSGKITLVNLGIPGLDFPGILTVGPSFTLSAQVVGDVDVVMDMTVGLNFNVDNAQLAFPPNDKNKPLSSAFSIGDTPLTLNAAPDVSATGTLTAHLIPSLNLGVSALGGKAKANIFLNLDTNAALEMNLDGSASATKVVNAPPAVEAPADDSTEDGTEDTTDTTEDDGTEETTDGGSEETAADDGSDETATDDSTASSDTSDDATAADDSADASTSDDDEVFEDADGNLVDSEGNPIDDPTATDDSAEDGSTEDDSSATEDASDDTVERRSPKAKATSDSTDSADQASTDDSQDVSQDDSTSTDDQTEDQTDDSEDETATDDTTTEDDSTTDETADDSTADDATADDSETADDGTVDDETADDTTATTDGGVATTKSLGGCVNVNGAISVNAGAEGSFFGLFDKLANKQLFNKNFKIFTKCFGDQATDGSANSTATATADDSTDSDTTDDGSESIDSTDTATTESPDGTDGTTDSATDDGTAEDSATDDSTTTKRATRRFTSPSTLQRRVSLTCPLASKSSKKLSVTKGTVKSSNIKSSTT